MPGTWKEENEEGQAEGDPPLKSWRPREGGWSILVTWEATEGCWRNWCVAGRMTIKTCQPLCRQKGHHDDEREEEVKTNLEEPSV